MKTTRYSVDEESLAKLISGITSPLDKACVLLVLGCGLRLEELALLDSACIGEIKPWELEWHLYSSAYVSVYRRHAGDRTYRLPIGAAEFAAIQEYLQTRSTKSPDASLFVSASGGRLSTLELGRRLSAWCVRLDLEPITYGSLRKTFALRCISSGMQLEEFKGLFGYASWGSAFSSFAAVITATEAYPFEFRSVDEYFSCAPLRESRSILTWKGVVGHLRQGVLHLCANKEQI